MRLDFWDLDLDLDLDDCRLASVFFHGSEDQEDDDAAAVDGGLGFCFLARIVLCV